MKRATIVAVLLLLCSYAMAKFTLIERSGHTLIVDFNLDEYSVLEQQGFSSIMMDEAGYPQVPGQPSLPELEFKIGIPPHGNASYSLISSVESSLTLPSRLSPVPHVIKQGGISDYEYKVDEELYRLRDNNLIQKTEPSLFRGHPFAAFVLKPFRYDDDKTLNIVTSARIQITLEGNIDAKSPVRADPMAELILQQMLNYDDAQSWYEVDRAQVNYADFSRSPWWIRLETDKAGMYRINPSQLTGFPLAEIDPRSFRIFSNFGKILPLDALYPGEEFAEVPIQVSGEEDGSFDPSDYILFYGSDRTGYDMNNSLNRVDATSNRTTERIYHNPYSHNAVYWLTFAGEFDQPPLRIQQQGSQPNVNNEVAYHRQVVHVEEERQRRDQDGFAWFMSRMFGSSTQDYTFDVNLTDLDPSEAQLLEFRVQQEFINSGLTHKVGVFVNGVIIESSGEDTSVHTWYGTDVFHFKQETSAFQNGNNRILLRVYRQGALENLFFDFYRVTYSRKLIKTTQQYAVNAYMSDTGQGVKYEFSGPDAGVQVFKKSSPTMISQLPITAVEGGFTFLSTGGSTTNFYISKPNEYYSPVSLQKLNPVDLSQISAPIESVIVTSPEFIEQANILADMYLQNWGYHTTVVLQQDIFNQFNGGHPDPGAIRQYLKYIYFNAPASSLQGLTLLGLGTMDWRNYSGMAQSKNKVMVYQNPFPVSYACSDDYFAMLTNNSYPEIVVGRYPVSSASELTNMLTNFQEYTQNPTPGLWRNEVVFLADDNVNGNVTSDWQHTEDMQRLSNLLNPAVLQSKIFAAEYDFDEFLNKPKVRDAVIGEINKGKLLWYYIGHGSFDILGMQDYFNVATDMGRLQNKDHLPLFITASCEVSTMDHWAYESLGQKIVTLNNAGAIASVGATRSSYPGPNHSLMSYFVPNMVNRHFAIGEALIDAKFRYTSAGRNDDVYVILGDPYLHIVPPTRVNALSLNNLDNAEDALHPRQNAQFSGSFGPSALEGTAQFLAYDSNRNYQINDINLNQRGPQIFRGSVSVENSNFAGAFFVPDDILTGNTGLVLSYLWDEASSQDYVSYYHPMPLSSEILPDAPLNESPPEISIYLGSYDFREGDTVSTSPLLYAKVSDDDGINLTSTAGHNLLLVIDQSLNPISVTEYFEYDTDSHTQGTLIYQMPKLSEGPHSVQIIAFDNQNLPQVAEASFVSKKSGPISMENLLIYPNPMKSDAHITFIISEPSEITLDIFTMSGKRIRRIQSFAQRGFNQLPFDGRDEFGARLANNTYFIRVRAKTQDGKSIEKRERLVIYK